MAALAAELQTRVKHAARTRVGGASGTEGCGAGSARRRVYRPNGKVVVIGASTGGVEALKEVLMGLPEKCPPILITQHMPPRFTAAFAERLNRECPMTISEAKHDDVVEQNHVYIAPGAHHLKLVRHGTKYLCQLSEEAPVSGHRPSVDVLFGSAARRGRTKHRRVDPDRHGQGRCARHAGATQCGRIHARSG